MNISLFEIIGPIMIGPSSSHTAGMARIGRMAHQLLPKKFKRVTLVLHRTICHTYCGHRTDMALIGGLLGIREDDSSIIKAFEILKEKNIPIEIAFNDQDINPNTVKIEIVDINDVTHYVEGISIGGGSISITSIDGHNVSINPSKYSIAVLSKNDIEAYLNSIFNGFTCYRNQSDDYLFLASTDKPFSNEIIATIEGIEGIESVYSVEPVLDYGCSDNELEGFDSVKCVLKKIKDNNLTLAQIAINYESTRSGRDEETLRKRMQKHLDVMRAACTKGMRGESCLNYGLLDGKDSRRLADAVKDGITLSGGIVPMAIARSIATMEINASTGCVVASPTAGSCGVVPGCMLTVQEQRYISDEKLVEALFISALVGIIMANRNVSFSGVVGGCQAEIGVSSAIAAAGLVYLGGGDAEAIMHAAALAIKNLLGLICDPIAGPVEVPCIKRNSVGVANAFAAADMALAGIRSYIPPDEVFDALVDTQRRLPTTLKGTTTGGLASTITAHNLRKQLNS